MAADVGSGFVGGCWCAIDHVEVPRVAGLLAAGGWTVDEVRTTLASSPDAADAPDPGAQEK
ncbi:hypothetical protein QLQ12_34135 [Actinoplanes sp. NEAU-A12]|uniref:Uncharacterized protein n=1 Tax=Actinoplanes sandaracinus TaxID=3045177 RepID=A0ABT6WVB2_9ACTN|nr:hypothetical protein [Actinoplanes sandaracinus]MDI6103665.1 hypothetical protein [Actinoplanes sandaracinus]